MAGLPIDHYDARIVSLQTAVVNHEVDISTLQDDVTSLKAALENIHGGLPMNQEDLMKQLLGTVGAAGSSPLLYDDVQRMKVMMEDATRGARIDGVRAEDYATKKQSYVDQYGTEKTNPYGTAGDVASIRKPRTPPGGLGFPGTSGDVTTVGSTLSLGKYVSYPDEFEINKIIAIRNKLDDFLDGSNVLIKVMNPQTIREMVREMRQEIRTIKKEENISELDIVEHLEKELKDEENRKADARARIDKYDADNEVPF